LPRIGVFGGSFNPIHFGHLLVADEVCERLALDRVIFVPAAVPPHKPSAELAPAADRFAMTALAAQEHPRFEVSDVELCRPGPSYTVDTLAALSGRGELFLIVGSETFLDLLAWRQPGRVAALARLVVIPRSRHDFDPGAPAAHAVLRALGLGGFVPAAATLPVAAPVLAEAASLPISGSDLRRRAREGRSLAYRMPQGVVAYIRAHGLYRGEQR
jgi:nicotinate-nucleotide adenylyltransferase